MAFHIYAKSTRCAPFGRRGFMSSYGIEVLTTLAGKMANLCLLSKLEVEVANICSSTYL